MSLAQCSILSSPRKGWLSIGRPLERTFIQRNSSSQTNSYTRSREQIDAASGIERIRTADDGRIAITVLNRTPSNSIFARWLACLCGGCMPIVFAGTVNPAFGASDSRARAGKASNGGTSPAGPRSRSAAVRNSDDPCSHVNEGARRSLFKDARRVLY